MSFKETEFGRVPSDWNIDIMENTLDAIIDYRGKTPKKAESGIETLSAKSVKNGFIDYSSCYYISKETYDKFMVRGYPQKGDILMTTEAPLGCVAKLDKNDIAIAQRLLTLRGKDTILDNDYLMYYLMSKVGQHQLNIRATGTTVLGIKQTEFRKVPILLPQLEEQKAIAKILSDLDEKVEINNKINKNLEEMAQAIFKQWFVDFEFPNEEGKPYKSSGGEMVESELGMIPKGWKIFKLGDFIKFIKGKKPKKIEEKFFDGCELYLTIDVLNRNSEIFANKDKIIEVNDDDILMVMDGASSGSLYYGLNGILGSTLAKISVLNTIDKSFLYYYLKLNESSIKSHLTGSAIPHTDKEFINKLCLAIPNDEMILKKADTILNNIRNHTINLNTECSKIKKVRDTLLPKLMSGEIRVPLENNEN